MVADPKNRVWFVVEYAASAEVVLQLAPY